MASNKAFRFGPIALTATLTEITAASIAQSSTAFIDQTDGKILLAPNTAVTVQGIGTATSGIVSMIWEEIPIV